MKPHSPIISYLEAGFTERFTKWGSVEEAFKFWGERGVKNLEAMKAKE